MLQLIFCLFAFALPWYFIGGIDGIFTGIAISIAFFAWGFTLVRPNQAAVVERLGKYHRVLFQGWYVLFMPGLIDRVTTSKNQHRDRILILQRFAVPVFGSTTRDGEAEKIDFLDGTTAAVRCDLWMQIGDPTWTLETQREELEDVVKTYIYGVEDAKERARSLVDDIVRPLLQGKTVDQILSEKSVTIDGQVKIDLSDALQEMGLWLAGTNPVTIGDVALEQTYRDAREKKLVAMKEREAAEEKARGIRKAAEIIAKGDDGTATGTDAVPVAEGLKIQQRLAAIEAARGSKLTLVQPSIGAATAALLDGDSGEATPQQRTNTPRRRT